MDSIGIEERILLNPNYKFKGNPFNSIDDMIKVLNVVELSPYYTNKQIIQFFMNGLLSFESREMQKIQIETSEEMIRMM
ncbi:MAG: hypothetical protein JSS91_02785 [Bacteroidetes bacterium]|nr:hypothetical protein [Bacteroidota bacterium]